MHGDDRRYKKMTEKTLGDDRMEGKTMTTEKETKGSVT